MQKPNIIFILADDLGYADLGCYGGEPTVSPNLDRLAARGLRFTHGYANSAVCSPTRFALITGRWQYRVRGGQDEPMASAARGSSVLGLDPAHPTLPSLLREGGYRTALFGKWHLGFAPHFGPLKSGYETFFGAYAGGIDYFSFFDSRGVRDLWEQDVPSEAEGYFTDLISERAAAYVTEQSSTQPFFMSLHYTAPHWPWETRADRAESDRIGTAIAHLDGGSVATYRQMIREMDEGIARVVAALESKGMLDNTLIVFTSDNGGERYSNTWPFVGKKMDLLEGGLRVPLIAHWPARIQPGLETATPAITMDWHSTICASAGVRPATSHSPDGIDLSPVFKDPAWNPQRPLFWRMNYRKQKAMRLGDWKYFASIDGEFLYNLAKDDRERANFAALEPDRLAAMKDAWEAWSASLPEIPADAGVSVVYDEKRMSKPSH